MKNKMVFIFLVVIISFVFDLYFLNQNNTLIYDKIKCVVCNGQSIKDSQSEFAENIKIFVKNKQKLGKSEKEILEMLRQKYGDEILINPELNLKTLMLWIFPSFFFLLILKKIF